MTKLKLNEKSFQMIANQGPITFFPKPVKIPPVELSPEQQVSLDELFLKVPELAQDEQEKEWLDRGCLLRYLRATKWDLSKSSTLC